MVELMSIEPVRIMVLPSGKVDRANAAKALGRTSKTLAEWKRLGIGPRSQTINGREFYDWSEVLAFGRGDPIRAEDDCRWGDRGGRIRPGPPSSLGLPSGPRKPQASSTALRPSGIQSRGNRREQNLPFSCARWATNSVSLFPPLLLPAWTR